MLIGTDYSDGGYSGATTDRPGFQRLLSDVAAGRVDCIAVYRIDRLSRSFADYVGILKLFEKHSVTFVSVTEQFNTTTPTGRLVLNQLILFSQFEREVIGERIRDKVRATRRRGAWTGGKPPLGYDVVQKKLVTNTDEALQVRETFQLYLQLGSLRATVEELRRRGWRTKTLTTRSARTIEGSPFSKTTLYTLLSNPLYKGMVRCGADLVPGVHETIVAPDLWDAVQQQLRGNGHDGGAQARNKRDALLRGILRCGRCGSPMTHTFSTKGTKRYRYYICTRLHGEGPAACPGSRVPAGKFEAFIADQIRAIGADETLLAKTAEAIERTAGDRSEQLAGEQRRGENELRRLAAKRADLLQLATQSADAASPVLADVAAIDQQAEVLGRRLDGVQAERTVLQTGVAERDLRRALAGFTPIWEHLFPHEQERVLRLLIANITYDPTTGDADIELRACGITTLAQEARTTP